MQWSLAAGLQGQPQLVILPKWDIPFYYLIARVALNPVAVQFHPV
jgi:hypothetical protein